jgi:predicted RNase H-like HicB family nuclease
VSKYQGLRYKIVLTPMKGKRYADIPFDEDCEEYTALFWFAEHPELEGCMSDGEIPEEAIKNLADARESWIEAHIMDGLPIPAPEIKEDVE